MKAATISCRYCAGPVPEAVRETGGTFCCYGCRVLGESGAVRRAEAEQGSGFGWRIGAGVLVAGQTMLFGLAANVDAPTGGAWWGIHLGMAAGAVLVLGLLGPSMVREACRCAVKGRLAVEWLFLTGAVAALGASLLATFTGRGAVYYEVVAVLMTVYAAGKVMTAAARARVIEESGRMESGFAEACRVRADGSIERVPVKEIVVGDRVRVVVGGGIPVDGVVESGVALVEETALTGEALPTVRRPGDGVLAGGMALDGVLEVRATVEGRSRGLDRLLGSLRESRATVEETVMWGRTQRLAGWFLPLVLGVAVVTFGVWMGRETWDVALYRALSVVLVACPCALGLAAPLALWSALSVLATRGVVLRRATAVEELARVTHVCVDKTGTLTDAAPGLADFTSRDEGAARSRWLGWMAEIERCSGHPYARAFSGVPSPEGFESRSVRWVPGEGVEAEVRDERCGWSRVRVGRAEWVGGEARWGLRSEGADALVAMSVEGERVGLAALRERAIPGWEAVVERWRALGCGVEVLSGDRQERLEAFGSGGAVVLRGGMRPEMKAERIRQIREAGGVVVFVGDGVNDGPALVAADVGLAVGSGVALAQAVADGTVPSERLGRVADAVEISRRTLSSIRGSFLFAGVYNGLGMVLAAAGVLHPVVAALLMTVSSTVVAWRSVRGPLVMCEEGTAGSWEGWFLAACVVLQIPVGMFLGAADPVRAGAMAAVLLTMAAWMVVSRPRSDEARMVAGMLGTGNLAMLIGWWVDAGWGPVMREGVCLCCRSHAYFEAGGRIPWMWVGMLAGGMPWMRSILRRQGRGWRWVLAAVALVLGMLVGMAWGGGTAVRWLVPGSPWQFTLAWAGMTVGMLLGMGLVCVGLEAWRVGMGSVRWGARA